MSKVKFDVVASTGKYQTANGDEKSRWMKCGVVIEGDDGRLSLKLEAVPIGEFSGWFSLFPPKDRQERQSEDRRPEFNDNIPF